MLNTLRNKIILLSCCVALGTSVFIGGLTYMRIVQTTTKTAIEGLAGETRLIALQFKSAFDEIRNDAFIVSRTPPFQGYIRSINNNNIDPSDGSTLNLWRTRMETIFMSVMRDRPHYTQMRFIGIENNAAELVRVNQKNNMFERVPLKGLQQNSQEEYITKGKKLKPGEYYFSKVTYNKEHGKIDKALTPTIRLVLPIHTPENNLFGLLVINTNYETLLRRHFDTIKENKDTYIVNHNGDYMKYTPSEGVSDLELNGKYTSPPPAFVEEVKKTSTQEKSFVDPNNVAYFVRLNTDLNHSNSYIGVVLSVSKKSLMQGAQKIRKDTQILSLFIICITLVITYMLAAWFTRPLETMTQNIIAAEQNPDNIITLPTHRKDEIGNLAKAFKSLMQSLANNKADQEKLIKKLEFSNQELDNFAYVASHDLKAPLRVIDNASKWLEEDLQKHLNDETRESMNLLRNRVRRMEKLLDDLLEYSRIGKTDDENFKVKVNGDALIADILQLLSPPPNFKISIDPSLQNVIVNRMPLQQILLNLINNAIKHHDKDNGHIEISSTENPENYIFTIKDDGPGIPAKFHKQIFKMFQTLKPRDQVEGSGMGLAMVYKNIEIYGGKITLESMVGQGTIFHVTWPKDQHIR